MYAIEQVTDVPLKFRFPYYKRLNWYALAKFDTWLQHKETANKLSYFELESIALLATFLRKDIKQNDEGVAINKNGSVANADRKQLEIPSAIEDPIGLTKRVLDLVTKTIKEMSKKEKQEKNELPPRKLVIRMKAPTPKPAGLPKKKQEEEEGGDAYFQEEEEDLEEDYRLDVDADDDDEFNVEDEDYDEEDTIPITNNNHTSITKIRKPVQRKANQKRIQVARKQQEANDSSSSDDDSMGTSRSKSIGGVPGLFSNRKRSLSNNAKSLQKSTKQRILDRVSKRH